MENSQIWSPVCHCMPQPKSLSRQQTTYSLASKAQSANVNK